VGSYGLLALAYITFDETLPLFLKLSEDDGGFGYDTTRIGELLSVAGRFRFRFRELFLYTGGVLFHVEWRIRQLSCPSTIPLNIISIANDMPIY